ncbi:MAG: YebC/PmpR family DNA-binding transcriptional regulator [Oscillospiraceae bacterium]|nr:YebC/PmpR family DNA-binding transcriptional regulator [Oscillospiraceae bacterium]MBQ9939809.1 YebC/PmpR family DNA-binding transcriptional regulator [Oscillospiraceae bacterium]
MSGHSKWNNIKKKKEKTDGQKAKIFTKVGREITVAVKEGGPDPDANGKLRDLIAKAKASNVPNENIERIIKKAAGDSDKNNYEEIMYEGYGPCGVAVIVEALTDNRNRTAGDVRHYFDKFGGNLGQNGCVSFMFTQKGVITMDDEDQDLSEDTLMEDVFESGADDFTFEDGMAEIVCAPEDLRSVREYFEQKGYKFTSAEVAYIPSTETAIDDPDMVIKMTRLLEMLDDNDDVQNVWHNWANEPTDDEE